MRLALFTDTYAPQDNGVARTLGRLVVETEARGGDVAVFTADDPRAARGRKGSIHRWTSVACPRLDGLRIAAPAVDRVALALSEFRPTLVHCATPFGVGLAGRRAATLVGAPLVTSYHMNLAAYARQHRLGVFERSLWRYLRWFHNAARRTFCPTDAARRELQKRGFERLAIWGEGVDTLRFGPHRRSRVMRHRLGAEDDRLVIGYVGRLARDKGLDSLLSAMTRIRGASSGVRFAFAGDGPYLEQCRRNAPPGTAFLGRLDGEALSAFYASVDLLVFPSTTDTFDNVLIEAMASGVPVVAADCAATREVVGGTAVLFEHGDGPALASAILKLMLNVARRNALGRAARIRASRFSWTSAFEHLFGEYETAIATRAPGAVRALGSLPPMRAASQLR